VDQVRPTTPSRIAPAADRSPEPFPPGDAPRIVTLRAVAVGLFLSIVSCIWITYSSYIGRSATIPVAHLPVAALLPYLLLVGVNWALKHRRVIAPFSFYELLVVFFMLLTASAIPGWAFTTYFVALIGTPYYFATPQNRWEEVFFGFLPDWLVASNQGGVMKWFFEGLPASGQIPWGAWLPPFLWWASFFLALFATGACMMILLRKQWVDHEKLSFPLALVPLMLAEEGRDGRTVPDAVRSYAFLAGFGITLFIVLWNIVGYFGWLAPIPVGKQFTTPVTIANGFPPILIRLNWLVFGFAFFANVDVLFSIWVFRLLAIMQEGILAQFGFNLSSPNTGISSATAAQNIGGFFFFVLWGLWMARRHLTDVVKKALGLAVAVDDSRELLSYRTALVGFLLGLVYILLWLNRAGMELWVAAVLMGCVLTLYLGVTRIVGRNGSRIARPTAQRTRLCHLGRGVVQRVAVRAYRHGNGQRLCPQLADAGHERHGPCRQSQPRDRGRTQPHLWRRISESCGQYRHLCRLYHLLGV